MPWRVGRTSQLYVMWSAWSEGLKVPRRVKFDGTDAIVALK